MKNIAKYSVNKPISVFMGILIVILIGIVGLIKLPLELFPEINLPYAVVVTTYEGKNPEEVEADVTIPVEQNLLTISNVKNIQSTSSEHFSMVIVEFEQSTNMDTAFLDMRESFELLELKEGVGNPMIIKFDPNMIPVMMVSISRDWEGLEDSEALIQTTEWVKEDVLNRLERIHGVASVSLSGAADTEIQLDLNQEMLDNYQLTQEDVLRIIEEQNISGLAGIVPDGNAIRMLYIGDKIIGMEALKKTPITYDNALNKIITLNDLASNIGFINAAQNQYMKINGKQGISISFQKQSDVGITETVEEIKKTLDEINEEYDSNYVVLLDQGDYIEESVGSVLNNLIIGGILAIIILYLFLRDIRPTLVVGLSIPISVIGAFALMYLANITLNIVSMGGLALGVGMLVDNSIVVIENIYRMLSLGKSPKEAAIKGAEQVAGAITSSTITTIAVFLPIVFIEGLTADLFYAMALTVTFSLTASLVIAISLVPSVSANILKHKTVKEDNFTKKLQNGYEKILRFTLRNKFLTMLAVVVLLGLSIYLASMKGFELLPATDEGTINISLEMEKGTPFTKTAEVTDNLVEEIMELDDYDTVSAEIGGAGFRGLFGGVGSTDSASITVLLKDNRKLTTAEVTDEIEKITNEIDDAAVKKITVNPQSTTSMGGFGGTGIQILIKGNDIYKMRDLGNKLIELAGDVKGTKEWNNGFNQADDVIRIVVNKENAIKRGLTEKNILDSISNFYNAFGLSMSNNESEKLLVNVEGIDYEVSVPNNAFNDFNLTYEALLGQIQVFDYQVTKAIEKKLNEKDENFALYILNIPFLDENQTPNPLFDPTKAIGAILINPFVKYDEARNEVYMLMPPQSNDDPSLISLAMGTVYEGNQADSIANVIKDSGFASINRDGKNRIMTVSAKIDEGYVVGEVSGKVEDKLNKYLNSTEFETEFGQYGYSVEFTGENEEIKQVTNDMILAGIVAILLVFMIMAIQFQSLKHPFIVFFTIPLAFTGGMFGLFFAGLPISMVAMVGFIILVGIIVNNGIVLVDYINQLREEGLSIEDAIIEAGRTRLRPILMTALTTILALIPMALGLGEGGELLQPLGVTSIGGLIYGTLLTLVIAPIMYRLFNRKEKRKDDVQ